MLDRKIAFVALALPGLAGCATVRVPASPKPPEAVTIDKETVSPVPLAYRVPGDGLYVQRFDYEVREQAVCARETLKYRFNYNPLQDAMEVLLTVFIIPPLMAPIFTGGSTIKFDPSEGYHVSLQPDDSAGTTILKFIAPGQTVPMFRPKCKIAWPEVVRLTKANGFSSPTSLQGMEIKRVKGFDVSRLECDTKDLRPASPQECLFHPTPANSYKAVVKPGHPVVSCGGSRVQATVAGPGLWRVDEKTLQSVCASHAASVNLDGKTVTVKVGGQ